jgi:hypothetical protein
MFEWKANYKDNTEISSREAKYSDIKRDQLASFSLLLNGEVKLTYLFDTPDKRLIYRLRTLRDGKNDQQVAIVGWQINHAGRNIQSITVMNESGVSVVLDGWQEGHILFSAPEPHKKEGEEWTI